MSVGIVMDLLVGLSGWTEVSVHGVGSDGDVSGGGCDGDVSGGVVVTHTDTFHTGTPLRDAGLSQVTFISLCSRDLF